MGLEVTLARMKGGRALQENSDESINIFVHLYFEEHLLHF